MKPMTKLTVFILSLNTNLFAQTDWFWQNPLPQGNPLLDIHVFDQNTALAVGGTGTVMKTTDGGLNWHVQHNAGGTASFLISVCFVPQGGTDTGWAVGADLFEGGGIILKTTDGGSTWSPQASGTTSFLTSVYFISENGTDTGWVVGGDGTILKTTDGGSTWSAQASGTTEGLNSVFFMDADTGWAVGDFGTILKTTDGGNEWYAQFGGTTEDLYSVHFIPSGGTITGWAVGASGTILKTTDGGDNWSEEYSGTENNLLSVYFIGPDTGWAVGVSGTILKTTDGGTTWLAQSSGTIDGLLSVYFVPQGGTYTGWTVGTNGTILKTTNGGTTWPAQTSGTSVPLLSVYSIPRGDTQIGWAVGRFGRILKTTDGGTTWSAQASGSRNDLYSVYFIPQGGTDTGWAVGGYYESTILKTTDGGATWSTQNSATNEELFSVHFADTDTGWAAGDNGAIIKTTDGGSTWLAQTSGTTENLFSVYFADTDTGWAVGAAGTILKTTNGGTTWAAQTSGTTADLHSVSFVDATTGWAVGDFDTILKTTDGGSTWSAQTSGTTEYFSSVSFIDANTGWVVGTWGAILKTTDGGSTWSVQSSGATNHLNAVYFIPQGGTITGWAVGDGGTILKTTSGETAIPNVDVQEVAIRAKPGETATATFKLSNTGTGDLSFNITASGPTTGSAPMFSAVLETGLSSEANSSSPSLPPLALNETAKEKPQSSSAQTVKAQNMSATSPAVVGDDVLLIDDGNNSPDEFFGLEGSGDTYWRNRFVASGNGFELERILVFARTDTVSNPSFSVAVDMENLQLVKGNVTLPPAPNGTWYTIGLSTPLSFEGGQVFFITIQAPKAIALPAGVDQYANVPNNSFYFEPFENSYVPLSSIIELEGGAFLIRAAGTKGADRLTVDPASGTISPGGSQTITVTLNAQGLAEGAYQGQLSIRSNGGNRVVPVRVHVSNTTGVDDNVAVLPRAFRLEQNYPNPFNPETSIRYALPFAANVSLIVFDLNGRIVARHEAGMKTAGEHVLRWNGRDSAGNRVPSGVYLYRLKAISPAGAATTLTKKMTLMK